MNSENNASSPSVLKKAIFVSIGLVCLIFLFNVQYLLLYLKITQTDKPRTTLIIEQLRESEIGKLAKQQECNIVGVRKANSRAENIVIYCEDNRTMSVNEDQIQTIHSSNNK